MNKEDLIKQIEEQIKNIEHKKVVFGIQTEFYFKGFYIIFRENLLFFQITFEDKNLSGGNININDIKNIEFLSNCLYINLKEKSFINLNINNSDNYNLINN